MFAVLLAESIVCSQCSLLFAVSVHFCLQSDLTSVSWINVHYCLQSMFTIVCSVSSQVFTIVCTVKVHYCLQVHYLFADSEFTMLAEPFSILCRAGVSSCLLGQCSLFVCRISVHYCSFWTNIKHPIIIFLLWATYLSLILSELKVKCEFSRKLELNFEKAFETCQRQPAAPGLFSEGFTHPHPAQWKPEKRHLILLILSIRKNINRKLQPNQQSWAWAPPTSHKGLKSNTCLK